MTALKIGVDGWRLLGRRTGVGTYLAKLLEQWDTALLPADGEVTVCLPGELNDETLRLPPNVRTKVLGPHLPMIPWQTLRLGPATRDDVLFCPSYAKPMIARSPTVLVMFEATQKILPSQYPLRTRLLNSPVYGISGRHATRVIAPTEAASDDIAVAYRVPRDHLRVVPMAPSKEFRPFEGAEGEDARTRLLGGPEPFFLHVGKLTLRRNVPTLIRAFARFKESGGTDHRLVVVGLRTLNLDLPAMARDLGIESRFHHFEYVPFEDLVALYGTAHAFVLPYEREVVSLTALEAKAAGAPVITSDCAGLKEQTGGAALYLDGISDEIVADGLTRLVGDPALHADLKRRGLEHARQFSWRDSAAGVLEVLVEAAEAGARR